MNQLSIIRFFVSYIFIVYLFNVINLCVSLYNFFLKKRAVRDKQTLVSGVHISRHPSLIIKWALSTHLGVEQVLGPGCSRVL